MVCSPLLKLMDTIIKYSNTLFRSIFILSIFNIKYFYKYFYIKIFCIMVHNSRPRVCVSGSLRSLLQPVWCNSSLPNRPFLDEGLSKSKPSSIKEHQRTDQKNDQHQRPGVSKISDGRQESPEYPFLEYQRTVLLKRLYRRMKKFGHSSRPESTGPEHFPLE